MTEHHASRTIVKSPPELWAECSDAGSLARHIGEFGEIRITRLEPETTVAWEGERASGTVEIEPSAWGTKVTLTAWSETEEVVQIRSDQVGLPEDDRLGPPEAATDPVGAVVANADPVVTEAASVGPPIASDPVRPHITGNRQAEEAADAKVEETSTEPNPAVAAGRLPPRGWKRVITRTRALFKSRTAPVERTGFSAVRPGESVQSQAVGIPEPPPFEDPEPSVPQSAGPSAPENTVSSVPEDPGSSVPESAGPSAPENPEPSVPESAGSSVPESAERPVPEVETAEVREQIDVETSIDPQEVLSAALESLGQAHHRPFSRS